MLRIRPNRNLPKIAAFSTLKMGENPVRDTTTIMENEYVSISGSKP